MQIFTEEQKRDRARRLSEFPLYVHPFNQMAMKDHSHDFVELVYVKKGHGIHRHAGRHYEVDEGDCYIIEPGDEHGYSAGEGLVIINILFLPELLAPYLSQLVVVRGFRGFFSVEPLFRNETAFGYKLHLTAEQREAIETVAKALYDEQEQKRNGYRAVCTALFVQMLALLSRYFSENIRSNSKANDLDAKEQVVVKAITYLQSRFGEKISLSDVASIVYLSVSHFSHVFKETTGMSLLDYLHKIRMNQARELFLQGRTGITDVSFEVGFHDPGYFARAFKKFFGVSPSQFCRENRGVSNVCPAK